MDFVGLVYSVLSALALLVTIFIKYESIFYQRTDRFKSQFEQSEKIFDNERWKNMPDFLLEKGYQAISGNTLEAREIRFIMSLGGNIKKFDLYEQAREYIDLSDEDGALAACLKNGITLEKLKVKMVVFSFFYFVFAILAVLPLPFIFFYIMKWVSQGWFSYYFLSHSL